MTEIDARQEDPNIRGTIVWTQRDDQRCGVLITGSRRADVFVAAEVLIFAETLDAEETVHAWLAQHGIQMAPKEKIPTRQSARDAVGLMRSDPAKARHDGGNDKR
jgi:hypothetical protein